MKYIAILAATLALSACIEDTKTSDEIQQAQGERLLAEGTAQTGMPAIKNFRERKTLKMIYELRDQEGLVTYTYIVPESTGRPVFLCDSIGYAISDATGYLNPDKVERFTGPTYLTMFQAEPNGLFTPDMSDANWILCVDPESKKPLPVFISSRILVSAFRLTP